MMDYTPRSSNKSLSGSNNNNNTCPNKNIVRPEQASPTIAANGPSLEAFMMMKAAALNNTNLNPMRRSPRRLSSEFHQHPQNHQNIQQGSSSSNCSGRRMLPPPPLLDACIDSPDTPRHFHIAQQAGLAARDRFEKLQRTSRLVKEPPPQGAYSRSSSHKPSNVNSTPDDLLLLTWDDVCVEQLLGIGGFACVCLATCDKLWKTHKRQYLMKKMQSSGDLASVDSSLLPPSEDSWMATSTVASNASTAETNAEKYYAVKCLSKQTIEQGYKEEDHNSRYSAAASDLVGEAFLLSKLDHPNIVRLYGVTGGSIDQAFSHRGGFFLVMEALNSVLDDMIQVWRKDAVHSVGDFLRKATEAVPCVEERLAIALEIARGMDYLHSKKIIFRDLKPHNVGTDREGGLRLFDFGLARECSSGLCSGKAGSRRYMAPETIANKVTCFASDVYSFGITLWELIGLVRPVHFENADEFERTVCLCNYRPSIDVVEDAAIRSLIESCWQKDFQQRPTFSSIIDSLQQILRTRRSGTWLQTKAGADLLEGGSFHLMGSSRHSKAGDGSSFQSLMNDSLMTDGSQSRVSALTMGSNWSTRTFSNSSIPSLPRSGSSDDEIEIVPKPQRMRPRRPPKGPRERPPDKTESETTVSISNTAQSLLTRRTTTNGTMDTDMDDGAEAHPTPSIPILSRRRGRPDPGPRESQQPKASSMTATVSAPDELMTPGSGGSVPSHFSNQGKGSTIRWQRRRNRSSNF